MVSACKVWWTVCRPPPAWTTMGATTASTSPGESALWLLPRSPDVSINGYVTVLYRARQEASLASVWGLIL